MPGSSRQPGSASGRIPHLLLPPPRGGWPPLPCPDVIFVATFQQQQKNNKVPTVNIFLGGNGWGKNRKRFLTRTCRVLKRRPKKHVTLGWGAAFANYPTLSLRLLITPLLISTVLISTVLFCTLLISKKLLFSARQNNPLIR